jgi:uncharacterized membrane protein YdbT with pleckstrin-like domain
VAVRIRLQEGEHILFKGKPEGKILVVWLFTKVIPLSLIITIPLYPVTLVLFLSEFIFMSYLLGLVISTLVFTSVFFYYSALKETFMYYITNQRCILEGGIIIKRKRNVPFYKITDVEITQHILVRLFGLYSLRIFTSGTAGLGRSAFEQAEIVFFGLRDAETPANVIQGVLKKYKATGD